MHFFQYVEEARDLINEIMYSKANVYSAFDDNIFNIKKKNELHC